MFAKMDVYKDVYRILSVMNSVHKKTKCSKRPSRNIERKSMILPWPPARGSREKRYTYPERPVAQEVVVEIDEKLKQETKELNSKVAALKDSINMIKESKLEPCIVQESIKTLLRRFFTEL